MSNSDQDSSSELTVTFLGCGTMGIAILGGILKSLQETKTKAAETQPSTDEELPSRLPTRFIACVRRAVSADRIKTTLSAHRDSFEVIQNDNVAAVKRASIVVLGCKPYMVGGVLSEPGMADALRGKLLISICAGLTEAQLEEAAYGDGPAPPSDDGNRCRFIRAMTNTASQIREGMTVINTPSPPLEPALATLVTWIFKRVGDVIYLPPSNMDASTALCGSGPAFFLLVLEAAIDGAVAMGLPRLEAQRMATQTMRGASGLVQSGEHPALLREKVTTPGGCTIGGLLTLEEGTVRGNVSRAVREATVVAGQLGKGVQGVNGTRPAPQ